jgi:hypothetical protein
VDAFTRYWAGDIEWRTMRSTWYGKEAGRAYLQELFDLPPACGSRPASRGRRHAAVIAP